MNSTQRKRPSIFNSPKARAILIAAVAYAIAALVFVLLWNRSFSMGAGLLFIAPLVTGLVAAAAWWLMLRLDPKTSVWRSAVVGALIGLAVHPFIWYLNLLFHDWSDSPYSCLGDLNAVE